jgi:hypothetical protein
MLVLVHFALVTEPGVHVEQAADDRAKNGAEKETQKVSLLERTNHQDHHQGHYRRNQGAEHHSALRRAMNPAASSETAFRMDLRAD